MTSLQGLYNLATTLSQPCSYCIGSLIFGTIQVDICNILLFCRQVDIYGVTTHATASKLMSVRMCATVTREGPIECWSNSLQKSNVYKGILLKQLHLAHTKYIIFKKDLFYFSLNNCPKFTRIILCFCSIKDSDCQPHTQACQEQY